MSTRLKIIALVAVLGALWGIHEIDKQYAVIDATYKAQDELIKQSAERTGRATKALKDSHRKAMNTKNENFKKVERELRSLIDGLRKRASRNDPRDTGDSEACTGAELYREDGEFLAGEADRAERVRIERDYLWERYEEVRQQLEKLNGK